jgi:peptidoglycan/xylan/chitin deacetylase (PgdA/CDA1 family)
VSRIGLPVLTYHAIGTRRSVTTTDPTWFAETLAALREAGYRAVDLDDWIIRGRPDEPRGFALVFDDGLRSILQVADLLARDHLPATVFLVTGRVGSDNAWPGQRGDVAIEPLLSWSDVEALARMGVRFGAHGVSHDRLDRLDDEGLERELRDSRAAIEDRLGQSCRLLAYPDGASSPRVRRVSARHFAGAFGTRLDYADRGQDVFDLARIDAYYLRTRRALDSLLMGRARSWLRWRRALRAVRRHAAPVVSAGRIRA